jgi:hypothetical protein
MNTVSKILVVGLALTLVGCNNHEPVAVKQGADKEVVALVNKAREKGLIVFVGIDPAPHQGKTRVGNKGLITTNFANGVRNNYRMTTLGRLVPESGGNYDANELVGVWERTETGEFNGISYGHATQPSGQPRGFLLKDKPKDGKPFIRIMIAQNCLKSDDEDVLVSFADFPSSSSYEQCKVMNPYGYLLP